MKRAKQGTVVEKDIRLRGIDQTKCHELDQTERWNETVSLHEHTLLQEMTYVQQGPTSLQLHEQRNLFKLHSRKYYMVN